MNVKCSAKDKFAYILGKDTEWLIWTCLGIVKVTLVWRFQLHKPKSALIRRGRHAEWHLLMTRPIQDTRALLGQVTGSVTLNKPAVPTEAERAGSWSACINFRRLQGLAVSIVVTIAEPSCLLGWHAVTPATVMFTQEAQQFLFFPPLLLSFFSAALALLQLISKSSGMWEELACLCRSMCEREKAGSVVVGSSSVHPVWGGRCVTLWGQQPAWQLRIVSPRLSLSLAFSFCLCFCLSVRLLKPLIYQFAIVSNIPIRRRSQRQL